MYTQDFYRSLSNSHRHIRLQTYTEVHTQYKGQCARMPQHLYVLARMETHDLVEQTGLST